MSDRVDDAARAVEQNALKSVRRLVEHLEASDPEYRPEARRRIIVVSAVIALAAVWLLFSIVTSPPHKPQHFVYGDEKRFGRYLDAVSDKIEHAARQAQCTSPVDANLDLSMTIRSDGSILRLHVVQRYGDAEVREKLIALVKSLQPFPTFAAYSLTDADVVLLNRTVICSPRTTRVIRP